MSNSADRTDCSRKPPLGWIHPALTLLFRVTLALIFIIAAWPKLRDPKAFAWSISYYRLVPDALINISAITLPAIELVTGLLLLIGLKTRACLLVVNGLLVIFIAAIASAMVRGLDIGCGCFSVGTAATAMTTSTLLWDVVWLAMGIYAMVCDRQLISLDRWFGSRDRRRTPSRTSR
ncbi:MAG: DoxX family membrane protein [Deltaproteobacteria bacterium]|nr:DoxX family membrane protein [Deltaproteobacteria bacterium]